MATHQYLSQNASGIQPAKQREGLHENEAVMPFDPLGASTMHAPRHVWESSSPHFVHNSTFPFDQISADRRFDDSLGSWHTLASDSVMQNSSPQPHMAGHTTRHRPMQVLRHIGGLPLGMQIASHGITPQFMPESTSTLSTQGLSNQDPDTMAINVTHDDRLLSPPTDAYQHSSFRGGNGLGHQSKTHSESSPSSRRQQDVNIGHRTKRHRGPDQSRSSNSMYGARFAEDSINPSMSLIPDMDLNNDALVLSMIPRAVIADAMNFAMRSLGVQPTIVQLPDGSLLRNFDELQRRLKLVNDIPNACTEKYSVPQDPSINHNSTTTTHKSNAEIANRYRKYQKINSKGRAINARSNLYRCTCRPRCDLSFNKKGDWERRQRRHYPQHIWICPILDCKKRVYFRSDRLNGHMATFHKGKEATDECCITVTGSEYPKECQWQHCKKKFSDHKTWLAHDADYLEHEPRSDVEDIADTDIEEERVEADDDEESEDSDRDADGEDDLGGPSNDSDDHNPGASGGSGSSSSSHERSSGHDSSSAGRKELGNSGQNFGHSKNIGSHSYHSAAMMHGYSQSPCFEERRPWKYLATYRLLLLPSLSWGVPKTAVVLKYIQLQVALHIESAGTIAMNGSAILRREIALMMNVLRESSSSAWKATLKWSESINVAYFGHSTTTQQSMCPLPMNPDLKTMRFGYSAEPAPFSISTEPLRERLRQERSNSFGVEPHHARDDHQSAPGLTQSSKTSSEYSKPYSSLYRQATIQTWLEWSATTSFPCTKTTIYSPQISVST